VYSTGKDQLARWFIKSISLLLKATYSGNYIQKDLQNTHCTFHHSHRLQNTQ